MKTAKNKNIIKLILFLIGMGFLTVGCEKQHSSFQVEDNSQDPTALLRARLTKLKSFAIDSDAKNPGAKSSIFPKISYDVKQTNSMVSPYIGTVEIHEISYEVDSNGINREKGWRGLKITLAFQQNEWVVKQVRVKTYTSSDFQQYIEDYRDAYNSEIAQAKIILWMFGD